VLPATLESTVNDAVVVTVPPTGGVTGLELKLTVTPAGRTERDSWTGLLNPFSEVTVTTTFACEPATKFKLEGEEASANVGSSCCAFTAKVEEENNVRRIITI
jgi:hypothetical protein